MFAVIVLLGSFQLSALSCQPCGPAEAGPHTSLGQTTTTSVSFVSFVLSAAGTTDRVTEIRIQGNYRTPEEDVRKLAGIQIGDEVDDEAIGVVQQRLEKSGRFDEVRVLKRWRTLDAGGDVVLLILVTERPSGAAGILGHLS